MATLAPSSTTSSTSSTTTPVLDDKKILSFFLSCDKLKQNHKFPKMEKMCREFVVKNSNSVEIRYIATVRLYLALALRELLYFNDSVHHFKLAISECPSMGIDPIILTDFGHSLFSAGLYEEAQAKFDLALEIYCGESNEKDVAADSLDWSQDSILSKLTRNALDMEELKSGLAMCQLMILDPKTPEYKDILFILKPNNQYSITHSLTFYAIGLYYEMIKDYNKAIDHYNGALKKDQQFEAALERMAVCQMNLGQFDKAKSSYDLTLQMNKQNYRALYQLAKLHIRAGMPQLSKSKLRSILTLDKQVEKIESSEDRLKLISCLAESYFLLGVLEHSSHSETKKVIHELFQNAIKYFTIYRNMTVSDHQQREEEYHNTIGLCQYYCEKYEESLDCFTQSIASNPQSANGFYNKGMLFETLRDYKQSLQQYKHALQLSPHDSDCACSVKRIDRLLKKNAFLHHDLL